MITLQQVLEFIANANSEELGYIEDAISYAYNELGDDDE
jgi:hypothetical protein